VKRKLYIETSVISYLTARPSQDIIVAGRQAATRELWDNLHNFEPFISELVYNEACKGDESAAKIRIDTLKDLPELDITEDCYFLAQAIINDGAVPSQFPEDALHIAIGAVHNIDFIVTLNFKHINNPVTRALIRKSVENNGYQCPELCSPDELIGGNDERPDHRRNQKIS
jgi:predicted nucleic acid-binding protein